MPHRQKINKIDDRSSGFEQKSKGDLYKFFNIILNWVLASENPGIYSKNERDWYVNNESIEKEFSDTIEPSLHQRILLVGHTGIGKSSFIRNNIVTGMNPVIDDETLYIPLFYDSRNIAANNLEGTLQAQITSACVLLRDSGGFKYIKNEHLKYIKSHRADLLYDGAKTLELSDKALMKRFRKKNSYAYYAELLKYFAKKSNIKRILIVVDDIDTVDELDTRTRIIHSICRLTYCLQNNRVGDEAESGVPSLTGCLLYTSDAADE